MYMNYNIFYFHPQNFLFSTIALFDQINNLFGQFCERKIKFNKKGPTCRTKKKKKKTLSVISNSSEKVMFSPPTFLFLLL
jgi:hypothetical protein